MPDFESIEALQQALAGERYLVDEGLATVVFLAVRMRRPLLVEGEPGVGKTELAKALAAATGRAAAAPAVLRGHRRAPRPLRLGLSAPAAAPPGRGPRRAVLRAVPAAPAAARSVGQPGAVLLIDELDRADDEFEAFLLEFLSDFQVTIPEIGVVHTDEPPIVIITSNRTRELHEALKRRCLYHWIEHPDLAREIAIARARLPEAPESLVQQVCAFVQELRWLDLYRLPGVGETLDWTQSLDVLGRDGIDARSADKTLGVLTEDARGPRPRAARRDPAADRPCRRTGGASG